MSTTNIIGYTLTGQDNDTYMFDDDDPTLARCATCNCRLDFQAFNPNYRLGRRGRSWDIASTYDGQTIVSQRFKTLCEENDVPGVAFNAFDAEPRVFQATSTQVIELDPARSMLRYGKKCADCGNVVSIVGPYRRFKVGKALGKGFYRSDLALGSCNGKSPLLVVSTDIRELLERGGLKGLEFSAAESNQ